MFMPGGSAHFDNISAADFVPMQRTVGYFCIFDKKTQEGLCSGEKAPWHNDCANRKREASFWRTECNALAIPLAAHPVPHE
jgi:hypothetical protein